MVVGSASNSFAKEVSIRRRIANIFNKREEDFPSLREYNDYLEEVEDMTQKLVDGIDVPFIEAKIAKYQDENAELIINNRARKAEEIARSLKEHQEPSTTTTTTTTGPTDTVITQNSQAGGAGQYNPMFVQPRPTAQPVPIGGMSAQNMLEDESAQRQRAEKAARAGGWTSEFCRKRAYEEAFSSLWVS